MKIDPTSLKLKENSQILSDLIRAALYDQGKEIFDLLDFDDDNIFLEPSLFCYFLSDIDQDKKVSLEQCLYGYITSRPKQLIVRSDIFGFVNLPNLGYLKIQPNSQVEVDEDFINENLIPNNYIENSQIGLCLHPTNHLVYQAIGVTFHESPEISFKKHIVECNHAVTFFQQYIPAYWNLIEICTREFVVFSSPDYNSFAGIMQHGTAYFNVENQHKSTVFFIDDIAHQCGHIIFNTMTYDTKNYLNVPKKYPLKNFSPNPQEKRGVYGAFHGLYTYSAILISLDTFVDNNSLNITQDLYHEALGRIGFYLNKFASDVSLMNNSEILTEKGLQLHKQFEEVFKHIYNKRYNEIKRFSYHNQPYIFQYSLFLEVNPI